MKKKSSEARILAATEPKVLPATMRLVKKPLPEGSAGCLR